MYLLRKGLVLVLLYYYVIRLLILFILPIVLILSSTTVYAQAATEQTFVGTLNIGHAHFDDGSHEESFYLFDYDGFTRPTVQLLVDEQSDVLKLSNAAGSLIAVTGIPVPNPEIPEIVTLQVTEIHTSQKSTVELDQKVYTWTDKAYITVVSPYLKYLDPNKIDFIGNEYGGKVVVASSGHTIDNFQLAETGTDTGIFTGEVILTGFNHNADGNDNTGGQNGFDTIPRTEIFSEKLDDIEYYTGFLETNNMDSLIVYFKSDDGDVASASAAVRWNIGEVQWLEASYPANGTGVVRVIDPDMNLNPEAVDNFNVDVWSDSDAGGIDLTVTETNEATGIFEGTVFFTTTDESSGHRLRVAEGDTVTAEYEDNTLPHPYTTKDQLDVVGQSKVSSITQIAAVDYAPPIQFVSHQRINPNSPPVPSQIDSVTILVKFDNVPTQSLPHTSNYFEQIFYASTGDSLSNYFHANSYGKLTTTGDVIDWLDLPRTKSYYVESNGKLIPTRLINDAIILADPLIDFNGPDNIIQNRSPNNFWQSGSAGDDVDQIIMITNTINTAGIHDPRLQAFAFLQPHRVLTNEGPIYLVQSFYADGGNVFPVGSNYQDGYGVVAHEVGHNFDWYHTPMLKPHSTYSDPWSIMSGWNDNTAPVGPIAYHKNKANWIEPGDKITVNVGEQKTINLDFLNELSPNSNSYHLITIPFGTNGEFYTIEARQDTNFDHIPENRGLMIYHFNPDGYGTAIKLQTVALDVVAPVSVYYNDDDICTQRHPNGMCIFWDYGLLDLELNETKHDPQNNITITLLSEDSAGMSVLVTNNAPSFHISSNPSSIIIDENETQISTITISSINGYSGPVTLQAGTLSSDLSVSMVPSTVTISPTTSATSTLTITTGSVSNHDVVNVDVSALGTGGQVDVIAVDTSVVPEFPFVIIVLASVMIFAVIFTRSKFSLMQH